MSILKEIAAFIPIKNFCFVLTEKCNIRCGHCVLECGPDKVGTISLEDGKKIISQIAELNPESIFFSGGEPLLFPELTEGLIATATNRNVPNIGVQTNALWSFKFEDTLSTVKHLQKIGITIMIVSTDDYHVEFVPFKNVAHVISACNQIGLNIKVQVSCERNSSFIDKMTSSFKGLKYHLTIQPIAPFGRGKQLPEQITMVHEKNHGSICLSTDVTTVMPDGDVFACCGPAHRFQYPNILRLGNFHDETLQEIIQNSYHNPLLNLIRLVGPVATIELLKSNGAKGFPPPDNSYMCNYCNKLGKFGKNYFKIASSILSDENIREKLILTRVIMKKKLADKVILNRIVNNERIENDFQDIDQGTPSH